MIPQNGTALPRRAAARDRDDAVVARLQRLGTALDGEPDPAFRTATRARLVAMAAVRTAAPAPASPLRRLLAVRADDATPIRWRSRLTAGLTGAAMTVTALATLTALASGARPGDVLYGLKRGTEQTQLALAGDSTRGATLLDFAATRLGELRDLVGSGTSASSVPGTATGTGSGLVAAGASSDLVLSTIHTMNAETTEGAAWLDGQSVQTRDGAPLDRLTTWVAGQQAGLAALQPQMPAAAAPALKDSLDLLAAVNVRATALESSLACVSGPAVSGRDPLGPVPAACVVPPVPTGSTAPTSVPPVVAGSTTARPTPGGSSTSVGSSGSAVTGGTVPGRSGTSTIAVVPTTPPGSRTPPGIPETGGIVPPLPKVSLSPVPVPGLPDSSTSSSSGGPGLCVGKIVRIGDC